MNPSEYFPLLAIPKFNNNGSLLSRKGAIVYRQLRTRHNDRYSISFNVYFFKIDNGTKELKNWLV